MCVTKFIACFVVTILCININVRCQEGEVIKIMPLGDSITNDGRSRIGLWDTLITNGFNIDFVGSRSQNGIVPDPDHEGVGGATIQDVADKINDRLVEYEPDYINIMIGTNDVAGYYEETGDVIAEQHDALIQQIFDNATNDVGLVVSTIPPASPEELQNGPLAGFDRAENVQLYNEALKENMQVRIDAGEKIVLADVYTPLAEDTAAYLYDGVHPNSEGYEIVGAVWGEAMVELLELDGRTPTSTEKTNLPDKVELEPNYPNPFNPYTHIRFSLNQTGKVKLSIYDTAGREISTLVNEVKLPGQYIVQWNADGMASGIYYCKLLAAGKTLTQKMTLVK